MLYATGALIILLFNGLIQHSPIWDIAPSPQQWTPFAIALVSPLRTTVSHGGICTMRHRTLVSAWNPAANGTASHGRHAYRACPGRQVSLVTFCTAAVLCFNGDYKRLAAESKAVRYRMAAGGAGANEARGATA